MKKLLLGVILLLSLLGCSFWGSDEADWTVLVYMAADNGLTFRAEEDIQEMMSAQFSDDINVIVQVDYGELSDDATAQRYRILPGERHLIKDMGEIDSGDYHTLAEFADWGFDRYPADNYALIIWSHGNGWYDFYNTFCPDKQSNTHIGITNGDLRQALKQISPKPDLLLFDACNMLTMEVVSEVCEYTDFVVGSEISVPSSGFPYNDLLSLWQDYSSVATLAPALVQAYIDSYKPGGSQNPNSEIPPLVSCAAVKTKAFTELLSRLQVFVADWQTHWQTQAGNDIFEQARLACFEFNDLNADIDIKQYFCYLSKNSADSSLVTTSDQVLEAIDAAFVAPSYYEYPQTLPDLGTAALWYPVNIYTFSNLREVYGQLQFDKLTGWQNFLDNTFVNKLYF